MQQRASSRPDPIWVWLIGLIVLLGAVWLLVDWVSRRDEAAESAAVPAAGETAGEAEGTPEEREAAIRDVESASVPIPLAAIVPLGPEDTGIQTTFAGVVVGDALEEGAWVRTNAGVIFVRIVDGEEPLDTGAYVDGRGIVRHAPDRVDAWLEAVAPADAERSPVVGDYYIETTADRLTDPTRE